MNAGRFGKKYLANALAGMQHAKQSQSMSGVKCSIRRRCVLFATKILQQASDWQPPGAVMCFAKDASAQV